MPAQPKQMLHVALDRDLIRRLDEYRFRHRFLSRTAALVFLLEWALAQDPKPKDAKGRLEGQE